MKFDGLDQSLKGQRFVAMGCGDVAAAELEKPDSSIFRFHCIAVSSYP